MGRKLPTFLRPAEAEAIVAAARSDRDRLILLCGLLLGLRVAELCHLRIPDIDSELGAVFVNQGKGGTDRYVPLPARLVAPLRAWVGQRKIGWLFPSPRKPGRPLTTRAVHNLVVNAAARAAITRARISPHKLRHTYATRLKELGADIFTIKELLGHAKIETTLIYTHIDTSGAKPFVDRL